MYDPSIGRFLSEDPLGFEAGDENLYRYVQNRPTVFTDPSGLQQQAPLPPGLWHLGAQKDYNAAVANVNDQLDQIDDLLDNPAAYYNNGGAIRPPGVSTLSFTLATRIAIMGSTANSFNNAGFAVFLEDLNAGAGFQILRDDMDVVLRNLNDIVEDYDGVLRRLNRQIQDVNNISNTLGRFNAFDRELLAFGNPLRLMSGTVEAFRDVYRDTILPSMRIIGNLLLPIISNFAVQQTCEVDSPV